MNQKIIDKLNEVKNNVVAEYLYRKVIWKVIPETRGRVTGLFDKTGGIFEVDILLCYVKY